MKNIEHFNLTKAKAAPLSDSIWISDYHIYPQDYESVSELLHIENHPLTLYSNNMLNGIERQEDDRKTKIEWTYI